METISFKVGSTWTETSLTALGVGISFKIEFGTHGESKVTLPLPTSPPETNIVIPFEAPCILYTGRTLTAGAYTGGSILFQGRRTDNSGSSGPQGANQQIVIEDAWYDLRFITMQAAWINITGYSGTPPTPTYGTPYTWPDVVLFQASPDGQLQPDGTFEDYSPVPFSSHITTGQSIYVMLAYAIFIGGVNLQIGQIDPACYVPFYPVRAMRIADCIIVALRVHPDCACEIDHTTTPPTFNIRQRSNLTSITLPYKSSSGGKTHLTSQIRARPDLIPSRVAIYIKETTVVNNTEVVNVGSDIYPPGVAAGLRSLDASVDVTGPKLAKTYATLTTAAFDPTSLAWWQEKVPALAPQPNGQIPASGSGALALLDAVINGGMTAHPKGIQVTDNSGNAINLATYGYELLSGTPASWMGVAWIEANVTAYFKYTKATTSGGVTVNDVIGEHMHTVRVKLINTASATFRSSQVLSTGEVYPTGLAENIYTALATLQYKFVHVILESPFATIIKPGKHCLNLSGGNVAWETMNAMIQSVTMEFMSGANGLTVSKTTVNCGPVLHLDAKDLYQIFNLFTNRDLSKINPNECTGGTDMGGGSITLGSDSPKENSVHAPAVPSVQNTAATDVTSGNTNLLTVDSTQGIVTLQQFNASSGTNITTGHICPCYSGSGSPSATSLPANAYYRLFDRYIDSTTKNEWICTGAGNNNVAGSGGSTWSQIGGVGGTFSGGAYNWNQAYSPGNVVWVDTAGTWGGVYVYAGIYLCIAATVASPAGNQVPQFPLPTSGTVYWRLLGFAPQQMGTCTSGGAGAAYVQSSANYGL
jgi:hypothetical protein